MSRRRHLLVLSVVAAASFVASPAAAQPPRLGLTLEDRRLPDGTLAVVVSQVVPGSPATRARLAIGDRPRPVRPGDVVVGFAGEAVEAGGSFAERVAAASGRVELLVRSPADRRPQRLLVNLAAANRDEPIRLAIGLTVRGCESGIHVEAVESGSPAAECREGRTDAPVTIAAGSHLLSIDGDPVGTPAEAADRLATVGAEIHLEIEQPKTSDASVPPIVLCVIGRRLSSP